VNLQQNNNIASTIVSNPQLPFSNEPLAPVTRSGDDNWAFFVQWITEGLFIAEANNITKSTFSSNSANSNSTILGEGARLVGLDTTVDPALLMMGHAVSRAIAAVGNYGEIYNATFINYLTIGPADIPYNLGGCHYYTPFE